MMGIDKWSLEYYYWIFKMRQKSYGEIAYETYCRLSGLDMGFMTWDRIPDEMRACWENTAASVLAEYHKRQIELSRQTNADTRKT